MLSRYISVGSGISSASRFYSKKLNSSNSKMEMLRILSKKSIRKPQPYEYFLVVDFEATCDVNDGLSVHQEIIEFPVLKLNSNTLKVESKFHSYVRPRLQPELSHFCSKLTGIIQEMVDESPLFPEVLSDYLSWHEREIGESSFLPVTFGNLDFMVMFPRQCGHDGIEVPDCFKQWHNIKLPYYHLTKRWSKSLAGVLRGLEIERVGKPHRGLDDCYTVSNIVCELIRRGMVIVPTNSLQGDL